MCLKQALVGVSIEAKVPFLDQPNTTLYITEEPNENVHGGDGATHAAALHVIEEVASLVKAERGGGLGEDEEEAVVGEGFMAEIGGKGGAEVEEFESEGRVFEGFENLRGFERGEGEGEGVEVIGEVGERVGE